MSLLTLINLQIISEKRFESLIANITHVHCMRICFLCIKTHTQQLKFE